MKKLLLLLFVLSASTMAGQNFKFSYTDIGLGSNRFTPPELVVEISDSVLTYKVYEETKEYTYNAKFQDTSWVKKQVAYHVPFRRSSRDSVLQLLKGKEGKYIFLSNPGVMSGGIQQLYFEYRDWCTEFSLKNTFDSTAMKIVAIINPYLPKDNDIYIPYDLWKDKKEDPLIKNCPGDLKSKYVDVLGDEYDLIRQNK